MTPRRHLITFVCVLALGAAACQSGHSTGTTDEVVGAPCTVDTQCAHRCYQDSNGRFPGGFCSQSCQSDLDCPGDTYCVATANGVCMFKCPPFDCAFLGPDWRCAPRDHVAGGQVPVCIGG